MSLSLWFSHLEGEPCFNMGFDEWMLGSALSVPGLLIVRLYTWSIGTITFGCNQRQETALDWSKVGETPVVRRVTGGRAVYHDPVELTYSLALNPHTAEREYLGGSVAKSSALFSKALHEFAERLGTASAIVERSAPSDARPEVFHKAPCFASAARHELMALDHKIVASAQRQVDGVILQHGSIKLHGLAPHPALPGVGPSTQADVAREVDRTRWEREAVLFRDIMGAHLRTELPDGELTAAAEEEILLLTERVRLGPAERRAVVKQTGLANSL